MIRIGKLIFTFLCLLVIYAYAGNNMQVLIDRDKIGLGDTATIQVQVSTAKPLGSNEIQLSSNKDFKVLDSNRSESVSVVSRMVPGQGGMHFENSKEFTYQFEFKIAPLHLGMIEIPAFQMNVDGKTMRTSSVQIQVLKDAPIAKKPSRPSQPPDFDEEEDLFSMLLRRRGLKPPPNVFGGPGSGFPAQEDPSLPNFIPRNHNEAFFIHTEVDKKVVYEGEGILVSWYFYTRGHPTSFTAQKFPDLRGFWKEVIEQSSNLQFRRQVIQGVEYRVALLSTFMLFPMKTGSLTIDEYKIKSAVSLPGNFGMGAPANYTKSSDRLTIEVKPLPSVGKPKDFSGAVGDFTIRSWVEGKQFFAHQPLVFRLRFEGHGNAKSIELPAIDWPQGVEVFEVKNETQFFKNGTSFKEFQVTLIPRAEGLLRIPSISISQFNPRSEKYITVKTEPIDLQVLPGDPAAGKNSIGADTIDGGHSKDSLKENENSLPAFEFSQSKFSMWTQYFLYFTFMIFILALVLLFIRMWKIFEWGFKNNPQILELKAKRKNLQNLRKRKDDKEFSKEVINFIHRALQILAQDDREIKDTAWMVMKLAPSFRNAFADEILKTAEQAQLLAFAPDSVVESFVKSGEYKKYHSNTLQILDRLFEEVQKSLGENH